MTTTNGNGDVSGPHRPDKMNGSNHEEPVEPYRIRVSGKFIVTSLLASLLLSFSVGRAARLVLLEGPRRAFVESHHNLQDRQFNQERPILPPLTVRRGEQLPKTRYTSKNFDTSMSSASSNWLITERDTNNLVDARQCHVKEDGQEVCTRGEEEEEEEEDVDTERQANPSSEHVMVDIKHVSAAFLNSELRLAQAMVDLVNEVGLTLLSYHCHGLTPAGVSCVGVLKQNYVSFHTWPVEGVITFDLCVGGNIPLLPAIPTIKRLFGVPRAAGEPGPVMGEPEIRWAHKLRGYRVHPDNYADLYSSTDLGTWILGDLDSVIKERIASIETDFQQIDIYDTLDNEEDYKLFTKALVPDGSYESRHPLLFQPDRIVMLDGWLQSTRDDEISYHEALVHPALFSHPAPKRVAVIGGGEAATLREVLKHNTVEDAIMIEIDETMVKVSREYLPEWSNCTDFGADWCVEDPRTQMYYEDALAWFMDRYPHGEEAKEKKMDVVIMDALDPESEVQFAQVLYGNKAVIQSFYDSLSDDGILVMQLGQSSESSDAVESNSAKKNRAATTELLTRVGFQSIHAYEESHCGFRAPWTLLVAFKSYETRTDWYATSAEIDLEMAKRRVKTKSGLNPFKYFDGATMVSYQVPPRAMEDVYCLQDPEPAECKEDITYDPEVPNIPISAFEVKMSEESDNAGRGVFTTVDIPEDAYLSAETSCHFVYFLPSTKELLDQMGPRFCGTRITSVVAYMYGYGFVLQLLGNQEVMVDSSLLTFANHGCRQEYNIGTETDFDEFSVDPYVMPEEMNGKVPAKYSPVIARHLFHLPVQALEDISAGDEILDNYLAFTSDQDDWEEDIRKLRLMCSGEAGEVSEYEEAHRKQPR